MKFEKFLKNCGARGTIVETTEGQFLKLANVFVKIPLGVNVLSALVMDSPDYIDNIFDDFDNGDLPKAELTAAILPEPDASPSKVLRIWSNEDKGTVSVDNKTFGIIERSDHAYTFSEDQDDAADQDALVITTGYGSEEYVSAIILNEQFYYDKLTEKENKK